MTDSRFGWALALCVLLGAGCASTPYDRLVPPTQVDQRKQATQSVSVSRVTRSYESNPLLESTVPKVSPETFHDALIETLRRSQLFGAVTSASDATYRLSADIVAEKLTGAVDNTLTLLIRYELERGGGPVWSENILSQAELSAAEVFVGAERHRRLQITAFRDNLAALLERLSNAIAGD